MSWGDNPGKGGQPGCNPPSPSGFSPPVPRFPPSPSPSMQHPKLHIPMMLHKTLRDEIYFMKSCELFSRLVLHKSGESYGKESTVVARTPVDGSCVTHMVKQVEYDKYSRVVSPRHR